MTSPERASARARSSARNGSSSKVNPRVAEHLAEQLHHRVGIADALRKRRLRDGDASRDGRERSHHRRLILVGENAADKMQSRTVFQHLIAQRLCEMSRLNRVVRRVEQHERAFLHTLEAAAEPRRTPGHTESR